MDMSLQTWYEKGLTPAEYMDTLEKHKDGFHAIYEKFSVPTDAAFEHKNIRALVLAEPWCGHCMLNLPILLQIAEQAQFDLRFLLRDENLDLMDQYLTNGKSRTVPIMIFIDKDGNQVATWGPVAPKVKAFIQEDRDELPDKSDPTYEEKFKAFAQKTSKEFTENESIWKMVYDDIKKALSSIL